MGAKMLQDVALMSMYQERRKIAPFCYTLCYVTL